MISDALVFLKNQLNSHLKSISGRSPDESWEDKVVFLDGDKMDPVSFKLNAVTVLLINLERETILRAADPYTRKLADGSLQKVQPDIRLNLYVLFVARFKEYDKGLSYLSAIIKFFQINHVFNQQNAPALIENIDHLIMELITLPFAEQNEVWSALRATYQPSVLYKVKMLVFEAEAPVTVAGVITDVTQSIGALP